MIVMQECRLKCYMIAITFLFLKYSILLFFYFRMSNVNVKYGRSIDSKEPTDAAVLSMHLLFKCPTIESIQFTYTGIIF